jgi:hypothetical protein
MSLDREIEDLLAVDPSPEFLATVRQRIAAEPAPSPWRPWWQPVAAGVGLAAVVAAALLWRSAAPGAPGDAKAIAPMVQRPSAPASETSSAPATSAVPAGTASVEAPSLRRTSAPSNHIASLPVLIQRDEAEAMKVLLTRVREGALPDMTEALAAVDATAPEWIAIHPVVIEPITTGGGE